MVPSCTAPEKWLRLARTRSPNGHVSQTMLHIYETTIDNQGHLAIPAELRKRHGLTNGMRVKIEERDADLIIRTASVESKTARQLAAIDALTGFLPPGSKIVEHLLEERKIDRERENWPSDL